MEEVSMLLVKNRKKKSVENKISFIWTEKIFAFFFLLFIISFLFSFDVWATIVAKRHRQLNVWRVFFNYQTKKKQGKKSKTN